MGRIFKHKLSNGNTLIWLGKWKNDVIDNVLILSGGDVLLLKSICHISLMSSDVRSDLLNLSTYDFIKKYNLNTEECEGVYYDIIPELKKGIITKEYPAFAEGIDLDNI